MTSTLKIDPSRIDAVLFDIGGVFAIRNPDPVRAGMARGGFDLPEDRVRYHEAHFVAVRALTDVLDEDPINEYDPNFWRHFEYGYFGHLGVAAAELARAADVFRAEVYAKATTHIWSELLPTNIAAFHRIAGGGIPVGIVSNNEGTAEQQMIDYGICQVGPGPLPVAACVIDSTVVGIAKPDPAIFLPALEAIGTAAARTLYVGDTVHADVRGATAAGMPVVQLDPYGLHAHLPHARLPDVAALAALLLA